MKRVTFYYVRHGRTLFNEVGKMQGWSDSPLTEEGIANAYQAKKLLEDINFNHIYTSTSERCIDTANIINVNAKKFSQKDFLFVFICKTPINNYLITAISHSHLLHSV